MDQHSKESQRNTEQFLGGDGQTPHSNKAVKTITVDEAKSQNKGFQKILNIHLTSKISDDFFFIFF